MDSAKTLKSEQRDTHNRQKYCSALSGEVVKRLLLDTKGKIGGIRNAQATIAIVKRLVNGPHVGDQELAFHIVIGVKPLSSGERELTLHGPMSATAVFNPGAWEHRLSGRE
jgi:hypothetical protein